MHEQSLHSLINSGIEVLLDGSGSVWWAPPSFPGAYCPSRNEPLMISPKIVWFCALMGMWWLKAWIELFFEDRLWNAIWLLAPASSLQRVSGLLSARSIFTFRVTGRGVRLHKHGCSTFMIFIKESPCITLSRLSCLADKPRTLRVLGTLCSPKSPQKVAEHEIEPTILSTDE